MSTPSKPSALTEASNENDAAWLLNRIWERINERNEHFVGCFVGREGAGKSLTSIKVAEMVDTDFTADENVIFHLDNFLEVLADEEYGRGDVYVLDEAGVQLGNRTWQDRAQVLGNQALQLIRNHNVGLIFTLPRLSELDKQARGRLQLLFEVNRKVPGEFVEVKPKRIDPDRVARTGNIYKKYPRRTHTDTGGITVNRRVERVQFTPPSEDITERYEQRKDTFQKQQYRETIAELRGEDNDEPEDPQVIAQRILDDGGPEQYIESYNGGTQVVLDWRQIANDHDLGESRAKRVKRVLMSEVDGEVM